MTDYEIPEEPREKEAEEYNKVILAAKEYYNSCRMADFVPKEGSRKLIYELGQEVRSSTVEKIERMSPAIREEWNAFWGVKDF